MNKRSNKQLRYILVPFLAAVMFIAAISLSDSYNSSSFPEFDGFEAEKLVINTVSAADMSAGTVSVSDIIGASPTDAAAPVSVAVSAPVSRTDAPADTAATEGAPAETTAAQTTEKTTEKTVEKTAEKTTEKTAAPNGKRENAPYVEEPEYESPYYIIVFLKTQNVLIYTRGDDGGYNKLLKCFTCSSGKKGHSTRLGMYRILRRYRWRLLVGDVYGQYSTGFSSSYLFHSVPYLEENDPSTLDMAEYDKLGSPASKGCIRLCVRDAKWIFENCPDGTQINIVDAANDTEGEHIIPRKEGKQYAGWDPSDPDPASPYNKTGQE